MFTQCFLLQRNSWWDRTCIPFLAGSVTSWLLNSQSPQHHFKKETFFQGLGLESKCKTAQPETVQRQPARTVPEQPQRALRLWSHETHPSRAPQLPFAWCGNLETAPLVQCYGHDGFSCLPRAGRGAKKNQILVLLNVYFTYCCWDMSQGHHAQPHSKGWRPEDTAPVTPSPFFPEASWVSPLPEAAV